MDKFGSPPSFQMFPSILRMPFAKMCAPEMTATIQEEFKKFKKSEEEFTGGGIV